MPTQSRGRGRRPAVLDVSGVSTADGANIVRWSDHNGTSSSLPWWMGLLTQTDSPC